MHFGEALAKLREGEQLARRGWASRDQYVVLMDGYPGGIEVNQATATAHRVPLGTVMWFNPYLAFRTRNGSVVPWVASHTDLLADDWHLYHQPL